MNGFPGLHEAFSVTWEAIKDQLEDAAVQVRPEESPRVGSWHSSPGATLAVLAYAARRLMPAEAPLEVRMETYLRFICAIDWIRTNRSLAAAPDCLKYPDFLGWVLCTVWSSDGPQWMEQNAFIGAALPPVSRVRILDLKQKNLFSGMPWFLSERVEKLVQARPRPAHRKVG